LRAENEELLTTKFCRIPAHACVLGEPEYVAAWAVAEHFI
jgi:hypothetical protein